MRWLLGLAILAQTVTLQTDPYANFPFPYAESVNHTEYKRDTPDDGFAFCRLQFTSNRTESGGNGWRTDYPLAERHLSLRLEEMTTTRMVMRGEDEPVHWVVKPTTPALHRCPLLLANDVGTLVFSTEEVSLMREYFQRGGFLHVDDSWGEASWLQWTHAFYQVAPGGSIVELDAEHPVFGMLYRVHEVPQISNLNFWQGSGKTAERGESEPASLWGGYLADGHLAVLMSWNTDIGDTWEREFDSLEYFNAFAADGYALGINIVLYAMSH